MASSWFLFFSYQDDARSNTHQRILLYILYGCEIFFLTSGELCKFQLSGHEVLRKMLNLIWCLRVL